MDTTYSLNRTGRSLKWPVLFGIILLLLGGVGYFVFGRNDRFISPMPETTAVEIIFYTPTPEPVTPTSSPSATPKITTKPRQPSATSKPESTVSPTRSVSVTPTSNP